MNTDYIEDGYVKISRQVFNSKTFSSLNAIQKLITIYLILMANHQDNQWWDYHEKKFINISRGSFITSTESIKKKINDRLVTTQKVRTLLENLKKMQFLTMKTTNKYTLITIVKYDFYQNGESYSNKQVNELVTSKQQGDNKVITTNKNDKNVKNDKKEILRRNCVLIVNYLNEKTGRVGDECFEPCLPVTMGHINARFKEGRSVKDFFEVIDTKVEDWSSDEKMVEFLRPSTLFNREKFENYLRKKKPDKYAKYMEKEK